MTTAAYNEEIQTSENDLPVPEELWRADPSGRFHGPYVFYRNPKRKRPKSFSFSLMLRVTRDFAMDLYKY